MKNMFLRRLRQDARNVSPSGHTCPQILELAERGKYEGVAAVEGRKCGGYSGKGG